MNHRGVGTLIDYDGTSLIYKTPAPPDYLVERHRYETAEVIISDERTIRPEQRAKIYATIRDIERDTGDWLNKLTEYAWMDFGTKSDRRSILAGYFKEQFCIDMGAAYFSLSDCSVTKARLFCQYLLDFCLEHDISLSEPGISRTDDVDAYLYACLIHKKCAVCGKRADCHHVDAVGMGFNRKEIIHLGMEVMALCRECHSECHVRGQKDFDVLYHVYGIASDEAVCEAYKLNMNRGR